MVFLLIMQMFCIAKMEISVNNVVIKSEKDGRQDGQPALGEALLRFNQVARVYNNISESVGDLSGVMNDVFSEQMGFEGIKARLLKFLRPNG